MAFVLITGVLGCLFIGNQMHESGVTKSGVHLGDTTRVCSLSMDTQLSVPVLSHTHTYLQCTKYIHLCDEICLCFHFKVGC